MSRLGDLLQTERLRRKMTLKQVAKLGGVSEGYLKDVEEGRRIIQDDQARRILKKMGLSEHNEVGFSLDDIAATVDLETVKPTRIETTKNQPTQPVYSDTSKGAENGIWLDALASVLKRVPIVNTMNKEVGHRLLPVQDGKIEGGAPDKVFYLRAPDDNMRGFRILRDDLCLVIPSNSPIDDAIMLVDINGHRCLRKIRKLDAIQMLLQSYDREYHAENYALPDIHIIGRVTKVEFSV